MKAQELRIGNFAKFKHLEGKIISIDENYCELDCTSMVIKSDYEDLKPIPLTEEWLLKFGFQKIYGCYTLSVNGKHLLLFYAQASKREPWAYKVAEATWSVVAYTNCQNVHQLQNLYFALTGEELTLQEL